MVSSGNEVSSAGIMRASHVVPRALSLGVNACNADPQVAQVQESDDRIEIEVVVDTAYLERDHREDCADSVVVSLDEPLGDRGLFDLHDGQKIHGIAP